MHYHQYGWIITTFKNPAGQDTFSQQRTQLYKIFTKLRSGIDDRGPNLMTQNNTT